MFSNTFPDRAVISETVARMLLEIEAVHFRSDQPYTFTSGLASPVYIDCRKLISYPRIRSALMDFAVSKLFREAGFEAFDAVAGGETWTKPFPEGVDDWSHHYHGPDNNPQSKDRVARFPYLTQFIAEPRYAPAPQAAVSSAGRLFMAFGNVAWHEREEPAMNTLVGF